MRYQGGKSQIAMPLAQRISAIGGGGIFVSLFCGTCSVESKVHGFDKIILNDSHPYLIALLKGVQNGYQFPSCITPEEYKYIRDHKDEDPALTGFVGFGSSFGGKWFGGYARDSTGRNYADESKRSLLKNMSTLMDATILCKDYREVALPNGCVIYADPPYANTTAYSGSSFNSDEFWSYAKAVSESHVMFVSEQSAPAEFVAIWEKPCTRTLDVNKSNYFKATEKLFVHHRHIGLIKGAG